MRIYWKIFRGVGHKYLGESSLNNFYFHVCYLSNVPTNQISSEQWNQLSNHIGCHDLVDHIKQMPSALNYYSDKPHRIGTPIVLQCIGSHRQGRVSNGAVGFSDWFLSDDPLQLECNTNYFYVDKSIEQLRPMREDRFNHRVCSSSTFVFVVAGENSDGCIFKRLSTDMT